MIRQAIQRSLFCVLVFAAIGCRTSFEVVNSSVIPGTKVSKESEVVTYCGSYWGICWQDQNRFPADENCRGIHKVEAQSNLLGSLAAVLTLGLWAPVTVEYWCYVPERVDVPGTTNTDLPPE